MSWHVRGSYFETCNCDPICPWRRIHGVPGGRSTFAECLGVLSWVIERRHGGGVALDGLAVALATRYHDDESGSPWSYLVYLDERADASQRAVLEAIYTGALGGDALTHFPWAWKNAYCLGVRPVEIEVSHEPRRQWLRVRDRVSVRIRDRYAGPETVTCVIPGHDRSGEELVADELRVSDEQLRFEYAGNCGYGGTFDYSG